MWGCKLIERTYLVAQLERICLQCRKPNSLLGRSARKGIGYPLKYLRICLQCGRPGFDPWVGKICRRERLPTPVFWPGEFHGLYSPWGRKELDTTEQLSHTYGKLEWLGGYLTEDHFKLCFLHFGNLNKYHVHIRICCCCSVAKPRPILCNPMEVRI